MIKKLYKFFIKYPPASGPEIESDMGIIEIPFQYNSYISNLQRISQDNGYEFSEISSVDYKNKKYPIYSIRLGDLGNTNKQRVLILAGMHGNERAGLLAVEKVLPWLSDIGYKVMVLPNTNPVGISYNSRYNGQGIDINRDFKKYNTAESRLLRSITIDFDPDVVINFHEGPQKNGGFLWVTGVDMLRVISPIKVIARIASSGLILAEKNYFGTKLRPAGLSIVDKSIWGFLQSMIELRGMRTYGEMARRIGIPSVTTESSWRDKNIDERVKLHVELVRSLR